MRVGFFVQGEGPHLDCSKHLIESVRATMPGVEIAHITDEHTRHATGADRVIRVKADLPMAMRRVAPHASLEGEWLFIDTDCVVRRDVREVFSDDFDVAVTDRVGSIYHDGSYGRLMPYNMGVTFSRSPKFWREVLFRMTALPDVMKKWEGDQLVVGMPAKDWPKEPHYADYDHMARIGDFIHDITMAIATRQNRPAISGPDPSYPQCR